MGCGAMDPFEVEEEPTEGPKTVKVNEMTCTDDGMDPWRFRPASK
jgi:hypothetical protein